MTGQAELDLTGRPAPNDVAPHVEAAARALQAKDAAKFPLAGRPWVWPRVRALYIQLAREADAEEMPF